MKVGPSVNFLCDVIDYEFEHFGEANCHLFRNLYGLELNQMVGIAFVPYFDRDHTVLPIQVPDELPYFEDFTTYRHAHLYLVDTVRNIITPDPKRAGIIETVEQDYGEVTMGYRTFQHTTTTKIYYVTPTEYHFLLEDVIELSDIVPYPTRFYVDKLEPMGFDVFPFIRERVIPYLTEQDRKLLSNPQ